MQPQLQTKQFIELINAHNIAGTKFTQFQGAAFKRDVANLPDESDKALMLALYYAIQRDVENTKKYFEDALKYSGYDVTVCDNYLMALQSLCLFDEIQEKSKIFTEKVQSPTLEHWALKNSLCLLDIELWSHHLSKIERMGCEKTLDGFNDVIGAGMTLNQFCETKKIPNETIKLLGKITHECLEKFSIPRIAQSINHHAESPNLNINYNCDSARCSTDNVLDMNDYFIEKLIENNLDELPIVITFSRKEML
jgi:hypothetical protein